MTTRYQKFETIHHERWLDEAKALVSSEKAQKDGLTLEDAYTAVATMEYRSGVNPLVGKMMPEDEPAAEMNAAAYFGTADAIDTMLSYGNQRQARHAAQFAIELAGILPQSTEAPHKRVILGNVLGIDFASEAPVSEQLAGRLLPDSAPAEQIALAGLLHSHARTFDS